MEPIETHPPCLGKNEIKQLLYVDDYCLMSQSKVGLQRGLDKLEQYCMKWSLEVSQGKTQIVKFRKATRKSVKEKFYYQNSELKVVKVFKYLGVFFHESGTWNYHAELAVKQTRNTLFPIKRLVYSLPELPVGTLSKIYNMKVRPVLTYSSELWGVGIDKTVIRSIDANFCKLVLGVGRQTANSGALIELSSIQTCSFMEQQAVKYFLKLSIGATGLQKLCLDYQLGIEGNFWGNQMLSFVKKLGVESWIGQPITGVMKKELKKMLDDKNWVEVFEEAETKKSLSLFLRISHGKEGAKYLSKLGKDDRRIIANFRLGTFLWQAPKRDDGTRVCVLCGGCESIEHLLVDCRGVDSYRQQLPQRFQWLSPVEIMNLESKEDLLALAKFCKSVFKERKKHLS